MKQPKEPTRWLYPRAYVRLQGSVNTLLIIYPDGSCERQISTPDNPQEYSEHVAPCWADNYGKPGVFQMGKCRTAEDAKRLMDAYGRRCRCPAEYIGEIR